MDDIDVFLSGLGIQTEPPHNEETLPVQAAPTVQQEPTTNNLSEDDFNDILSDNGFVQMDDAEIVEDDEEEDLEEYIPDEDEDGEDLNEEEDEDWNRLEEAGIIRETQPEQSTEITSTPNIPINSPTLLIDDSTSRFSGTEWYNEIQKSCVIVAGLGGIGSWMAVQLARMNLASLLLYDDDVVEEANMSGQMYSRNNVGMSKVDALSSIIGRYTNTSSVYAVNGKFTENTEPGPIMICGFDSITARRTFFNSWKSFVQECSDEDKKKCLFMDGRLSIDTLQVLAIRGDDTYNINRYENEFLFSEGEADETICSMKQTTYLACMIGSFMVNIFTNFIANSLNPIIPYDLPFFTEYESQTMIFKTEN